MNKRYVFVSDEIRNAVIEECARVADLSGDNAATEKGRDMATGIALAIRALSAAPPQPGNTP